MNVTQTEKKNVMITDIQNCPKEAKRTEIETKDKLVFYGYILKLQFVDLPFYSSQGSHRNWERNSMTSNSMTSKLTRGLVKTMSEMPQWLNDLMLDTKFPKFLYFSTIGQKQFSLGKI